MGLGDPSFWDYHGIPHIQNIAERRNIRREKREIETHFRNIHEDRSKTIGDHEITIDEIGVSADNSLSSLLLNLTGGRIVGQVSFLLRSDTSLVLSDANLYGNLGHWNDIKYINIESEKSILVVIDSTSDEAIAENLGTTFNTIQEALKQVERDQACQGYVTRCSIDLWLPKRHLVRFLLKSTLRKIRELEGHKISVWTYDRKSEWPWIEVNSGWDTVCLSKIYNGSIPLTTAAEIISNAFDNVIVSDSHLTEPRSPSQLSVSVRPPHHNQYLDYVIPVKNFSLLDVDDENLKFVDNSVKTRLEHYGYLTKENKTLEATYVCAPSEKISVYYEIDAGDKQYLCRTIWDLTKNNSNPHISFESVINESLEKIQKDKISVIWRRE